MKNLKMLNTEISFSSAVNAYNMMPSKSTTTEEEAIRSLEALEKVCGNHLLTNLVKEES